LAAEFLLFKVSPERDLYMQWVMTADGPGTVNNRAYWKAEIARAQERNHPHFTPLPDYTPEAQMALCDRTGTTSRSGTGGWNSSGVVVEGVSWLERKDFERFADAYVASGGSHLDLHQMIADGICEKINLDETD
jgi:hypothetical protein